MGTRLYISNLPLSATREMLTARFGRFGVVLAIAFEGDTLASRRGAFVEMRSTADAQKAINGLNLADFDGRLVSVYRVPAGVPAVRS